VNSERWQEYVNTNFLYLHQDLGIPDRPTVSSHFYYQAAQWQCHNMVDMLANNELSDTAYKDDLRANTNTFEIGTTTIAVPLNVVQLGDKETLTGNVILNDFKIAKHYLSQQEQLTRSYVSRRDNFYKIVVANGDKRKHAPSWTKLHISSCRGIFADSLNKNPLVSSNNSLMKLLNLTTTTS
jgi:hypothetical protein